MSNRLILPVMLPLAALAVYLGTLDADFLYSWDDQWYVRNNPFIADGLTWQSFTGIWTQFYFAGYIPVTLLSYNLDYALWQMNPFGYHLTNVLLHTLNTALVFFAVRPLVPRHTTAVAAIAAALFAVHPLQVEVVAWVSQRKSLLGMLFFLVTWLLHTRSRGLPVAGWVLFAVTMLAKTSTIGAPLLFFLYDVEWRKLPFTRAVVRAIPYGLISLAAAYLQIQSHAVVDAIKDPLISTFTGRVQLALLVIWDYAASLVAPFHLNNRYYYSTADLNIWGAMLGGLVILGLALLALHGGRLGRFSAAGVVMFMLPVSNIIPIAIQRADRYIYFPSWLLFMLVGVAIVTLWHRQEQSRTVLSGVVGGVIVACAALTLIRAEVWSNSGTLWLDHRSDYPVSSTGLLNEGVYHYNQQNYPYATYLMTELVNRYPDEWKGYRFLGHIAYTTEDYAEAIPHYEQVLARAPQGEHDTVTRFLGESLFTLGLNAHTSGDYALADDYYQQAMTYLPENAVLYNNTGYNAYTTGNHTRAIEAYQRALAINPDYRRAYINLRDAALAIEDSALVAYAEENITRLDAQNES